MLNFRKQTPEQASLDLAIEGMRILSNTLLLAIRQLAEEGAPPPKKRSLRERFSIVGYCHKILSESGLHVGASRRHLWVEASFETMYLFLMVVEMVSANRLEDYCGPGFDAEFSFPSLSVFLEKAKTCEWGEYVDWAQDMSRSIVKSVGIQVDVLRDQLDQ